MDYLCSATNYKIFSDHLSHLLCARSKVRQRLQLTQLRGYETCQEVTAQIQISQCSKICETGGDGAGQLVALQRKD